MAIDSVNNAAKLQASYVRPQEPQPTTRAERPNRADEEAKKLRAEQKAQETAKPQEPKPVVNTQGQKTGTVINVTA